MTPTLHDLREALSDAESKAPDGQTVLARVRRGVVRRQRRRAIAAVAAIALFATVGMAAADQLPGGDGTGHTGSAQRPRFLTWFRDTSGYVSLDFISTTVQVASVGDPMIAQAAVYEPGAYDVAKLPAGEPLLVDGKQFIYDDNSREGFMPGTEPRPDQVPALRWEYAPGAWACLYRKQGLTKDELGKIAYSLLSSTPSPVRLPIRMAHVPAGLHVTTIGFYTDHLGVDFVPSGTLRVLGRMQPGPSGGQVMPMGRGPGPRLRVSVSWGEWVEDPVPIGQQSVKRAQLQPTNGTFEGRPAFRSEIGLRVHYGTFTVSVFLDGFGAVSMAEMERIAHGFTVARSVDKGSWFDADTAIP